MTDFKGKIRAKETVQMGKLLFYRYLISKMLNSVLLHLKERYKNNFMNNYLFETERLGIRNWEDADIPTFIEMGKDEEVMKYFPWMMTDEQSLKFINRMKKQFKKKEYAYLPIIKLDNQEFLGMVGLMDQNYENYLEDFVDIGWRLKKSVWGNGYATEAAKAWLAFGFKEKNIKTIYSVAPLLNLGSEKVMQKIGLEKVDELEHPKIPVGNALRQCCLYKKTNPYL